MAFFARYRCDLVLISCLSNGPCRPVANTIGMSLGRWVESGQRELLTEWYSAQGLQGLMVALKPLSWFDGLIENRFDVDAIHHLIA